MEYACCGFSLNNALYLYFLICNIGGRSSPLCYLLFLTNYTLFGKLREIWDWLRLQIHLKNNEPILTRRIGRENQKKFHFPRSIVYPIFSSIEPLLTWHRQWHVSSSSWNVMWDFDCKLISAENHVKWNNKSIYDNRIRATKKRTKHRNLQILGRGTFQEH